MSFWSEQVLSRAIDAVCSGRGPSKNRSEIIPLAEGRVLDVGVGSGLNLPHADRARVERWVGLDPSRALLAKARARAAEVGFDVELLEGVAEKLPFPDESFDTLVVTYTFCSVDDPAVVAQELARVVRRGGKLLFAEHGLAQTESSRALQRSLEPTWKKVAGGCTLQRDIVRSLTDTGRFVIERTKLREDFPKWMSTVRSGVALAE